MQYIFHLYFHPVIMDMIQKIIRRSMRDLEPMKTLRICVMSMHEEGIQVILDGVFNMSEESSLHLKM